MQTRTEEEREEYLTIPELGGIIKRSPKTVYTWIRCGQIGAADGVVDIEGELRVNWTVFKARRVRPYTAQKPITLDGISKNGLVRN